MRRPGGGRFLSRQTRGRASLMIWRTAGSATSSCGPVYPLRAVAAASGRASPSCWCPLPGVAPQWGSSPFAVRSHSTGRLGGTAPWWCVVSRRRSA
eukprot:1697430-Heterocapsa_arctica.AAC.1